MSLTQLLKIVKDRGNFGHKGRPGFRGGSGKSYKIKGLGFDVHIVKPGNDIKNLKLADTSTVIFNTESKNWHIADGPFNYIQHNAFMKNAREGSQDSDEAVTVRGAYNRKKKEITLYDFSNNEGIVAELASDKGISDRHMKQLLEKNLDKALSSKFTDSGEVPTIRYSYPGSLF